MPRVVAGLIRSDFRRGYVYFFKRRLIAFSTS